MNKRCFLGLTLMSGLCWAMAGHAAEKRSVQAEVDSLLASVEASACSFYRNGSWHDSKTAVAHLREKYDYLVVRNLIVTTEDFIERAASRSSISGQAYEVKCGDHAAMESARWLREKLALLRAT